VGLCQFDAPHDKADEDTLERALEQLGDERVEVRWDGLNALHGELMGCLLTRRPPFIPLMDWLVENRYAEDEEAAKDVLGPWLHEKTGALNYPAARRQLGEVREGGGMGIDMPQHGL
jgi:hypothetical protein